MTDTFFGMTLEQLEERALLNVARGIRVSPELRRAIQERRDFLEAARRDTQARITAMARKDRGLK
jgi:hypothetical protein